MWCRGSCTHGRHFPMKSLNFFSAGRRERIKAKELLKKQANRGFARSRLCAKEDGNTHNLVLYTVRNDTSKKGGNAPRATD